MIFAALQESAERGELILVRDGFLRYHVRKDGVLTIREILVLPFRRRTKLGTQLLQELTSKYPENRFRATCPTKYIEANLFWISQGFHIAKQKDGLNVWERESWVARRSSGVQTAIKPTPA